jgi:hypothetical protein
VDATYKLTVFDNMFAFGSSSASTVPAVAAVPLAPERKTIVVSQPKPLKPVRAIRALTRGGKGKRAVGRRQLLMQPPLIETSLVKRHTFRFVTATTPTRTMTVGSAIACFGATVTVINAFYVTWASSVRIRRVSVWAPAAASGEAAASIIWASSTGPNNSADTEYDDSTVGSATPASATSVPPVKSLVGDWWTAAASTTVLATVNAPASSVVDVVLECCYSNNLAPLGPTALGSAAGALGTVFYGSFDGGGAWSPVGLPTNH